MPKYAILDTETSGLPDFKLPADHSDQPRLASITLILTDDAGEVTDTHNMLVQPEGWEISPSVTAINGLTTERCATEGRPLAEALNLYSNTIKEGFVIVAYNAQFDCKVMRGELRRAGMPDMFEETPNICAMRACDKRGIEKAGDKKGGFPKLSDAYRHFFGEELSDAHTSLADATACLKVFRELSKLGWLPDAAVHYAKVPPAGKEAPGPAA